VALTAAAPHLDAEVDPRFGRAAFILLTDSEGAAWEALANPAVEASGGAGVQAAQLLAEREAGAVVSGDFGPKARQALQAAGIAMYGYRSCKTAREALEEFRAGRLPAVGGARRRSGRGGSR
jgi:predicted Fe-Mo cluster-binding NifX family protein